MLPPELPLLPPELQEQQEEKQGQDVTVRYFVSICKNSNQQRQLC
jgi:hypothetical protein